MTTTARPLLVSALLCACASAPACKPPAVAATELWLSAYANDDIDGVLARTFTGDRKIVREALEELRTVPTGTLATALPPRPLRYEIVEIESKDNDEGRWTLLVKTTLKNPLPFMSKKVGHLLEDMPKIREQKRRYLVVREGERWGVKLDLNRVVARDLFAAKFFALLEHQKLDTAEAMLKDVPPPPDEANALKKSDRLRDTLKAELDRARKAASKAR